MAICSEGEGKVNLLPLIPTAAAGLMQIDCGEAFYSNH